MEDQPGVSPETGQCWASLDNATGNDRQEDPVVTCMEYPLLSSEWRSLASICTVRVPNSRRDSIDVHPAMGMSTTSGTIALGKRHRVSLTKAL